MVDRFGTTVLVAWFAALAAGIVLVASAAATNAYIPRHCIFVAAALLVFAVISNVPLHIWESLHRWCLVAAIGVCALVLVPGIGLEEGGARRWIWLGAFTLQPSEAAKFLLTVYLAAYFARAGDNVRHDMWSFLRPLAWAGVLAGLVLIEPDFGTTLLLAFLTGGLMFLAGARLRHFLGVAGAAAVGLIVLLRLEVYREERLVAFLDPWALPHSGGYQLTQALIAFGRGEWFGVGLGEGVQKLSYLPEAHNDFIFAVVAEELGLIGAGALFLLLAFLVLCTFSIARAAADQGRMFGAYLAYGAGLVIGAQVLINVGVNTGVLPTTGLTLPFISFGGNSLLVCAGLMALAFRTHLEGEGRASAPHSTAPVARPRSSKRQPTQVAGDPGRRLFHGRR